MDHIPSENAGLSFSREQISAVLSSPAGKQLLSLLGRNGGAALQQAAQALRSGDADRAKQLVSPLMQTPEAQALIAEINQQT